MIRVVACVLFVFASACVERALDGTLVDGSLDGGIVDLMTPPRDGSVAFDLAQGGDLSLPGLTCAGIVDCLGACADQDCFDACYGQGSTAGRMAFDAASECANSACAEPCMESGDACDRCGADIGAKPGSCGGRPACGACATELAACGF